MAWLGVSWHFRLHPLQCAKVGLRSFASLVLARFYKADVDQAALLQRQYWVGDNDTSAISPQESWKRIEAELPGLQADAEHWPELNPEIPFVYESMDAPHLKALREQYDLQNIIAGAEDEYDAMLKLGAWIGKRWDHGTDPVPGGSVIVQPADVIQAGESGSKFWCEIAAKVTVLAATALGWTARLTTSSQTGYRWQHAVAEFWSNQHQKWFMIDTDFNVVYETNGIPLSAFELCHTGLELQTIGQLQARTIAPAKPSLPLIDLLPFFEYIHVEMRTDWYSRRLRRGSPAGGELATWWTARPTLQPVLTAKIRVEDQAVFDWPVNSVAIYARRVERINGEPPRVHIGLRAYCPYFKTFEIAIDEQAWETTDSGQYAWSLSTGQHEMKARVVTLAEQRGPVSKIIVRWNK